ncbi:hypothetical protein GGQ81_000741 [Sphingomonas desiccabilis]|nr:hypothetical protein [Sphingomonas desiccabilis]
MPWWGWVTVGLLALGAVWAWNAEKGWKRLADKKETKQRPSDWAWRFPGDAPEDPDR